MGGWWIRMERVCRTAHWKSSRSHSCEQQDGRLGVQRWQPSTASSRELLSVLRTNHIHDLKMSEDLMGGTIAWPKGQIAHGS